MAPPWSRPLVLCSVFSALIGAPLHAEQPPAPVKPPPDACQGVDPQKEPVPYACNSVAVWCEKAFPGDAAKCSSFTGLLIEQEKVYGELRTCAAQPCAYDDLFKKDGRVNALNEQMITSVSKVDDSLDDCKEFKNHDDVFFRVQAALRGALAEAWKKSLSTVQSAPSPDSKGAASAASSLCSDNPDTNACSLAETVAREAREFETINAGCSKARCSWQESKQLLVDFLLLKNNYGALYCLSRDAQVKKNDGEFAALDRTVAAASNIMFLTTKDVTGGLDDAEKKESALRDQIAASALTVDSLTPDEISGMEKTLNDVGGNVGSKSLMIDEMNDMMYGEVDRSGKSMTATLTAPLRERVNADNESYVQLRAQLKALRVEAAAKFGGDFYKGAVYDASPGESDPSSALVSAEPDARRIPAAESTAAPTKRPLDAAAVPPVAAKAGEAPPIIPAEISKDREARMLLDPDPAVRADVEADVSRKMGLTRTIGDPGRRAKLAYPQDSPDACGLVAEQEVLRAYGRIPATDPERQQQELRDRVAEDGLFSGGTPTGLSGALLEKYWLPTRTSYRAEISKLNDAAMTGDFVIASVDARPLWSLWVRFNPDYAKNLDVTKILPHNILITGVEASNGGVVGYYVNDSGVPRNNSYFVPADTFLQAWNGGSRAFVQVLK